MKVNLLFYPISCKRKLNLVREPQFSKPISDLCSSLGFHVTHQGIMTTQSKLLHDYVKHKIGKTVYNYIAIAR